MTKEVFQLEVQVNTNPALTGLNQVDKKLKDVKKSADDVGKSGSGLRNLGSSANVATTALRGLGSVIAGLGLATIGTEAIKSIASMQSLTTVLSTVTGGATQAAAAMALLKDVSATTPFSVDQLGESFIKLKAAGIEPTAEQLRLFSDVASVTTDKIGSLQAITDLYARTTAGGLGLEEVNRLADRGIPVFDILSKRIGVSRTQISELGKTAEGAQLILRNLEAGLSKQFGGASAQSLNTLNGQFDTLIKNLKNLATSAGGTSTSGVTKGLTDLLTVLNEVIVSSDGTSKSVGKVLGDALTGLARTITFVADNFKTFVNILLIIIGIFLPFTNGIRLVILNFRALTAGMSTLRALWVAFSEVVATTASAWLKNPFSTLISGVKNFGKELALLIAKYPKLAALVAGVGSLSLFGGSDDKPSALPATGAGAGRGNGAAQLADYEARQNNERERAQQLLTGRDAIISKIVNNLKQEASLIGLSAQKAEETNAILNAQAQIREKLIAAGKTEAEAEKESKRLVGEKAGEIRNAVALKYQRILENNFKIFYETTQSEISLIGRSSNEIEKQTKLREIQIQLGLTDLEWAKEKLNYEEQITAQQNARITDSLTKNLEGIQKETEYLKLSNDERERRIALDQAAADAGYKNAQELTRKRPGAATQISQAIGARQQTVVDVAGRKSIEDLKEESSLLRITNELDREREKKKLDIYKAIDPEGKGKKINEMQKAEIETLLATIEAQNQLLEVNKKIEDGFKTLGDAVTDWALGGENAIKRVRLALVQLIALQAFKSFAGGMPTGAVGSFTSGILGGLAGARAEGGPVTAGKTYLVGEKRPELFVPQTNGYIVPNTNMISTKTGATNLTLSPNLIIQGSVTGQTELENMFDQYAQATAREVQGLLISQRGQNGILAR